MATRKQDESRGEGQTKFRGANFSDVLIEMGDDLERWVKGLGPWGAAIFFFAYAHSREWAKKCGILVRDVGLLAVKYSRAQDTVFTRWFRNHGTPAVRRFRDQQQDALQREQAARTRYWGRGWFFRNLRDLFGINPGL